MADGAFLTLGQRVGFGDDLDRVFQRRETEGAAVQAYLDKRQIRKGIAVRFGMGASPDRWDGLLTAMTRKGYTKQELLAAGLVVNGMTENTPWKAPIAAACPNTSAKPLLSALVPMT